MQVEDVAGIRFASRRTAQQQRYLAIGHRVLGEVIVDHQRVHTVVTEELAHRAPSVRGEELLGRGIGGSGGHHDGVIHRAILLQRTHHLRHRGLLLPDGNIDAVDALTLLVQDGIHTDGRLAGLAIADDEFALATSDGDHRINGHQPGLQRFLYRLALNNVRGGRLGRAKLIRGDRAFAVNRLAECCHHAADHRQAHRHLHDPSGGMHGIAFVNIGVGAQEDAADVVLFQVEGHAHHPAGKLDEFAGHGIGQPVDAGDAVADLQHLPDAARAQLGVMLLQFLPYDGTDFFRFNIHGIRYPSTGLNKFTRRSACRAWHRASRQARRGRWHQ
ncbi:MAG: hypothetical protein BWY76_01444 [bacterium ADurb.Bin429]|nr:MAG: hypothetical protein BWY76_01444 [bacterium ADurb.Bin429]